jgi:hypothetical protein
MLNVAMSSVVPPLAHKQSFAQNYPRNKRKNNNFDHSKTICFSPNKTKIKKLLLPLMDS